MKKKILITGCEGFIGQNFYRYTKRVYRRFDIYGADILVRKPTRHILKCDLQDPVQIERVLEQIRPDFIFHFAGGRCATKPGIYRSNYLTTQCLLKTICGLKHYHPKVIIPGSAAEYGKMPLSKRKVNEECATNPTNYYGEVKLRQTLLALQYAGKGMDVTVARMFNIYGSETPPKLAVGKFAQQIAEIEAKRLPKVIHTENLNGKRDYLDILDVCRALMIVARYGQSNKIYNICSGRSVSTREILFKMLSYSSVKNITVKENKKAVWPSFDVIGSNARLRSLAQWAPKESFEKSLKDTLNSYCG